MVALLGTVCECSASPQIYDIYEGVQVYSNATYMKKLPSDSRGEKNREIHQSPEHFLDGIGIHKNVPCMQESKSNYRKKQGMEVS